MRTWNKWRHIGDELSAFEEGALPPDKVERISEHLNACDFCRREYQDIRFAVSMARELELHEAPPGLWKAIEARWESERAVSQSAPITPRALNSWRRGLRPALGWNFGLQLAAAGAVCLLSLSAVLVWRSQHVTVQHSSNPATSTVANKAQVPAASKRRTSEAPPILPAQFDLAAYIEPVKASANDRCVQAISKAAPRFVVAEKEEAFRAAGLEKSLGNAEPLPGYRLLAYRVCEAGPDHLAQLVYSHGDDAFCVFVAPRSVKLLTGREAALDTQVHGIRCQKVDCPQQCTYLFGTSRFHYVLVSKLLNEDQAAAVMKYFISHRQPSQG